MTRHRKLTRHRKSCIIGGNIYRKARSIRWKRWKEFDRFHQFHRLCAFVCLSESLGVDVCGWSWLSFSILLPLSFSVSLHAAYLMVLSVCSIVIRHSSSDVCDLERSVKWRWCFRVCLGSCLSSCLSVFVSVCVALCLSLQRDHQLFLFFPHMHSFVILNVEYTGPPVISM